MGAAFLFDWQVTEASSKNSEAAFHASSIVSDLLKEAMCFGSPGDFRASDLRYLQSFATTVLLQTSSLLLGFSYVLCFGIQPNSEFGCSDVHPNLASIDNSIPRDV